MFSNFLFLILSLVTANADEVNKLQQFEVEWESKKDAIGYDVKLIPDDKSKETVSATLDTTIFKQDIAHGIYMFQVRAKYKNGQNGNWSTPVQVKVLPIKVELISPRNNEGVPVKVARQALVTFKWLEAQDAKQYRMRYWSDKDPKRHVIITSKATHTVPLDMGTQYHWEVELITKEGVQHQNSSETNSFYLVSGQLQPVVISDIRITDTVEIHWQTLKGSDSITGILSYRPLLGDTWTVVLEKVFREGNVWKVDQDLIPGEYKIQLTAQSKNHHPSLPSVRKFFVKPKAPELQPIVATDL